jgi:hypothetical protein
LAKYSQLNGQWALDYLKINATYYATHQGNFMPSALILFILLSNVSFAKSTHSEISIGSKTYQNQEDFIFRDSSGREVYFRGFNVSGAVKLKSMGFRPFKNTQDAEKSFRLMRQRTGANLIRFTIGWEGVHPEVDTIDKKYLEDITAQIKVAIHNKIYILLDYHQDLFSRYLFHKDSKHTGNGAPKFIIDGFDYPKESCLFCFNWGVANKLNKTVMMAFRNFWNNEEIDTTKGKRKVQNEFLWQLDQILTYLKNNLTPHEWNYILGLDPFNEPVDGGLEGLSDIEWNEKKLYAFYNRVRSSMDKSGWESKVLFAEPVVFWNTNAPFVYASAPVYPGLNIKNLSFNAHFYDAGRMSVSLSGIKNGAYIANLDHIKNTARKISAPPFLSEFGMWIENGRVKNQSRIINATYQGMEISKELDSNYLEFYSPLVSGTQWHWDYYHNKHREALNDTDNIITHGDGWNNENFSLISDDKYTTPDRFTVERSFPRRCQGDIMHFYYHSLANDGHKGNQNWAFLKFGEEHQLTENRFSFLVWKGSNSLAPTEIFIPPHFLLNKSYLITDNFVGRLDKLSNIRKEVPGSESGHLVEISNSYPDKEFHFALIVSNLDPAILNKLQQKIKERVDLEKSPIFLNGKVKIDKVHVGNKKLNFKKIKGKSY